MQFTTIALALASSTVALGAALAAAPGIAIHAPGTPVATSLSITQEAVDVKRSVEKRATGHFFVCTDSFFGGICQNLGFTTDVCFNLGSPFQDSISSAGPDSFACNVYENSGCTGATILITNPGINNLADFNFNDKISSYRCHV